MCISGAAGYMEYNLTCPETFIFSHIENLCTNVTSYKCFPDYNCTAVGNFEADSTENCRAFISCVEGISGLVAPRLIECPQGTVFNLTENSCVNETLHKCNKSPKVLTVLINHVPKFSGNFTVNKASITTLNIIKLFSISIMFYAIKQ
ncbi:unnamed protein product [Parnassius mnemosyne]|uniref:Chitin-binding type-2 domain-containing protein n=1 Tax=Parnassius mnemosyne TaxID=213953 RepID=A0AAV1K640_9NEOP